MHWTLCFQCRLSHYNSHQLVVLYFAQLYTNSNFHDFEKHYLLTTCIFLQPLVTFPLTVELMTTILPNMGLKSTCLLMTADHIVLLTVTILPTQHQQESSVVLTCTEKMACTLKIYFQSGQLSSMSTKSELQTSICQER